MAVMSVSTMATLALCMLQATPAVAFMVPVPASTAARLGQALASGVSVGASSDVLSLPRSCSRSGTATRMLAPAWEEFHQPSCRRFGMGGGGARSIFQRTRVFGLTPTRRPLSMSSGEEGIEEGSQEDEDDSEPDPAKDLAELVMDAVFSWNSEHEVVDVDVPWVDLEAVAAENHREIRELEDMLRRHEEEDAAARGDDEAVDVGDGGGDLEEGEERVPFRPPAEGTNIFEPSFQDEEEEEVDLEEPDARTVGLARDREYLYGFAASQLPQEVLDVVTGAGEETRSMAYSRLLAGLSSPTYQDNLRLSRQLKWTSRVLMPREEDNPIAVSDEDLTRTNVLAVKTLVNITDDSGRSSRASTGGWCLWLMKFLRNRDEGVEHHLAIDDETAGMMYGLGSQVEKDNSRMKAGGRMFRKALEEEVFKVDTGGLLLNTTAEAFGDYALGMGQRILTLAGEMAPAHGRAFDILRDMAREVFDDMASLAYDKVLIEMGKEIPQHRQELADSCSMTAAGVLRAISQIAFYIAEPLIYLKTGEAGLTTEMVQNAMTDLLLINTVFLENKEFYEIYARDGITTELTQPARAGTMKVGGRLLRRVMGMYKDDAVDASVAVLAEELSLRLYDADGSLPDVRRSWDNLMWNLEIDDDDDESEDAVVSAMNRVLAALVEKLIKAGKQKPSAKTAELCASLGMKDEDMAKAFSLVSADIFETSLLASVRDQGTASDGTPTALFRSDALTDDELKALTETAKNVDVPQSVALEIVAKELQVSLMNMVTRAAKCMRNNAAEDGVKIIRETNELLDGLCSQLVEAFGGTDITSTLSIKGQLVALDEYWSSELCFKMVDAVRDPEGALAEARAGIPGALTATPGPEREEDAQRILELLGLQGRR